MIGCAEVVGHCATQACRTLCLVPPRCCVNDEQHEAMLYSDVASTCQVVMALQTSI